MKVSKKIVLLASLAILSAVPVLNVTQPVNASTVTASSEEKETSSNVSTANANGFSQLNIEQIDQYIEVKNNQFYITKQGETELSPHVLALVTQQLTKANEAVKNDSLVIDPQTKEITSISPYVVFAAGVKNAHRIHSGCYVRAFWWGVRIYFTSNAAVNWFRGELSTASGISTVVGIIAQVTGYGMVGTLSDAFGAYSDSISNRLYNYNRSHRHSKIYMDAPNISFHTF